MSNRAVGQAAIWVIAIAMVVGAAPQAGAAVVASRQYPLAALPIVARVKVPIGPGWLETGFGSVWVAKSNSKAVLRIDPSSNRVVATIAVGSDPELGIGIGLGSVWVADTKDRTITQIDPATNRVVRAIPVDLARDPEGSIGVGEGSLWVMTNRRGTNSGTLTRIDAASGKVTADIAVKPQSHAVIVAFKSVWVTSSGAGTVTRVDPASNSVVAQISVHRSPRFLIASDDGIWVLSQGDGTLARIDPSTNRIAATIEVGVPGEGGDLSVGAGQVWVSAEGIPLTQIDPEKNALVRQFVGGRKDDTMRVAFGSAWVLDENHGEIWRADLEKLEKLPAAPTAQWTEVGHDAAGTFHSPLKRINTGTVAKLGFAWDYRLGSHRGLEATPIVIDGVMYASGNFGRVYALDAATGKERWVYDPGVDGQSGRYACCDAVNRGVAFWKGRVYVAALDGYLHAIDAATGRRIWKVDAFPSRGPKAPRTLTGVPVVAGNSLVIGTGGGDFHGVRGYVEAFDLNTGSLRWRFYTVPRDPALGAQDQAHLVDAVKTWDPHHRWETSGGGAVWDGISYDGELNRIYVGTGNAAPLDVREDGRAGGDALYSDSILALNADTGRLEWFFQVVPGDMWDLDSTQKMILADLTVNHEPRKVLMQASKNGFFYILDRVTGEFLSGKPYAFANWTKGLDPKSGRPVLNPLADYSHGPKLIFPWEGGAHSWQAMSFDPITARVFVPVVEAGDIQIETAHLPAGLVEGQFTSPIINVEDYDPKTLASLYGPLPSLARLTQGLPRANARGLLRAWDPTRQRLVWEVTTETYWNGGVLSTDGGLVIQGDIAGRINVYAARTGKLLKKLALGTSIMATPITYEIDGTQYLAVMAGYGGGQIGDPLPENSAAYRYGNEGRIIALKLNGTRPPLPQRSALGLLPRPQIEEATSHQVASGEILYNRFCSRCHVFGPGVLPDLRRLTPDKHALFYDIVLDGMLSPLGMGRFDDVVNHEDAEAIHAYIVHEAWLGFREQSKIKSLAH